MTEEIPPLQGSSGSGADKRRFQRAPLQLLIQHRFTSMGDFVEKWSSDISMGGVFLRTENPREEGAMVYLQFALQNGEKLIEGLGRVVRSQPPEEGRVGGMGIEFVNFDDESLSLIEDLVTARVKRNTPSPD